jgi:DNA (cytosine-5)-methyltransferase 1
MGQGNTFVDSGQYVAHTLNAKGGCGRIDGESETFVTHTLRGDGFDASEDGTGRGTPLVPVAFGWQNSASQGDSVSEHVTPGLDKSKVPAVLASRHDTLYNKGISHGGRHASPQEAHAREILRGVREALGEEAFAEWGLGILDSFQRSEVLRQALHGSELRPATFSRIWMVHCALSREEDRGAGAVQSMREAAGPGRSPPGWEPSEQRARQLGTYLSELSQPGAQEARFMRDLWQAAEGLGVLRQALSAVQEMGRSARREAQPAQAGSAVRRLTPTEAEFLQGFPRNYTAVPYRGKPAADGPRYKALGNSFAVPVVRWIGERIAAVTAREAA